MNARWILYFIWVSLNWALDLFLVGLAKLWIYTPFLFPLGFGSFLSFFGCRVFVFGMITIAIPICVFQVSCCHKTLGVPVKCFNRVYFYVKTWQSISVKVFIASSYP